MTRGDHIGHILVIEFNDRDTYIFDEIMQVLDRCPDFERLQFQDKSVISLPNLEIFLNKRKVYTGQNEIILTTKEYDLLCLLAINKGQVFTYDRIYERLWGEDPLINVNNIVGFHARSLRRKLNEILPNEVFSIRCIRNIGYCLEIK